MSSAFRIFRHKAYYAGPNRRRRIVLCGNNSAKRRRPRRLAVQRLDINATLRGASQSMFDLWISGVSLIFNLMFDFRKYTAVQRVRELKDRG